MLAASRHNPLSFSNSTNFPLACRSRRKIWFLLRSLPRFRLVRHFVHSRSCSLSLHSSINWFIEERSWRGVHFTPFSFFFFVWLNYVAFFLLWLVFPLRSIGLRPITAQLTNHKARKQLHPIKRLRTKQSAINFINCCLACCSIRRQLSFSSSISPLGRADWKRERSWMAWSCRQFRCCCSFHSKTFQSHFTSLVQFSKFFHSMNMQQLYWRQITVIILF